MSAAKSPALLASEAFNHAWARGWLPSERLTISQWADRHRILSKKASSEPGKWQTSRVPYMREIMDNLSPQSPAQVVVFMKSAQVGGSETGFNWIGYNIHHNPGPMLHVQPTIDIMRNIVKQRINPMIEASSELRELVAENKSRDTSNTIFNKSYPGGILMLGGSNSAASLRSMPIRDLFLDEVDAYPLDVDGEGDPVELAIKRTTTFARRKIFLCSTPTVRGASRIEDEYEISDKRRYYVPCPHCGHMQWLKWKDENGIFRIVWNRDSEGGHLPDTAAYLCEACDERITESHKTEMLETGEWRATSKSADDRVIGYHISALYSPLGWKSWADIVRDFLKAGGNREKMKTWVNTILGETWEEAGDGVDAHFLSTRAARETYQKEVVPAEVAVLCASVDVQGNRIEAKVIGYGAGEESWLVDYEIFYGNPSAPTPNERSVWDELDEWRSKEYTRADGVKMKLMLTLIDSGDQSDAVYDYVQPRQSQRVFAIKGQQTLSRPGLAVESTTKRSRIRLFNIATIAAKDRIFSRMSIATIGPGYMHIPHWVPEQYFQQMTAEKKIMIIDKRTRRKKYEYIVSGRNEALDLEVYCLAGLFILQNYIAPALFRDLARLRDMLKDGLPTNPGGGRRVRSRGI